MADSYFTHTLTIKGEKDGKSVTALNIKISNEDGITSDTQMGRLMNRAQVMTSAKITGAALRNQIKDTSTITNEPGDYLEVDEVFKPEFTDTAMVPSLQLTGLTSEAKSANIATIKYTADPEDTTDFESKVTAAASALVNIMDKAKDVASFSEAKIIFTAKDESVFVKD